MALKKTPFYQKHIDNGGRIVDFSGWALPLEYEGALAESKAVRSTCGLFDASHMGEILIKGKGALDFLQGLTTNNISLISEGKMQYNLFLNKQGGIIDDFMVYHLGEDLLCVVNASNKDKVIVLLSENKSDNVEVVDLSKQTALISVQGPNSSGLIKEVFGSRAFNLDYLHFIEEKSGNYKILISRSGYTGEDGFEIYLPLEEACNFWDKLILAGRNFGLVLCGLASRDILRIEAGYPLYGHEIGETINPYEASLGWAVKLNRDFIGKEKIEKAKEIGIKRKRVGFIMNEKAFPRQGYPVYAADKEAGVVCSGTYSANLDKFIGMVYIEEGCAKKDTKIYIKIRDRLKEAKVVKFPFINIKTRRIQGCRN